MGTAVLCRNFSGEAFVPRSLPTREIRTDHPRSAEGEASGRVRTNGLNEAAERLDGFLVSGVAG
jgi:hypothetical protein